MQNGLVSIIVPVYSAEDYIEPCIESIRNQTYRDIEVILVDDGSIDNSGKICDTYAERDSRIRVIHKKNAGAAAARNCGILEAKGEWYCFVDADDRMEPDFVEYLLGLCEQYHSDMACCMYRLIYENGSQEDPNIKRDCFFGNQVYSPKEFAYLLLCDKVACYPWNKIFKANLWENIRFNEKFSIYEDSTTIYKVASKSSCVVCGDGVKYNYLQRSSSLMHDDRSMRNIITYFEALTDQENYVAEHRIDTIKTVPFDLLRLENYRRYLKKNVEIELNDKNVERMGESIRKNKKMIFEILSYRDIFDKKSILSNIMLLLSKHFYMWQIKKRN